MKRGRIIFRVVQQPETMAALALAKRLFTAGASRGGDQRRTVYQHTRRQEEYEVSSRFLRHINLMSLAGAIELWNMTVVVVTKLLVL